MQSFSGTRMFLVSSTLLFVLFGIFIQNSLLPVSPHPYKQFSYKAPSPTEMVARAQAWVNMGVDYRFSTNPKDFYPNPQGYRRDCSGFISMIWGLPAQPGGGLSTATLPSVSYPIPKDQLKEGDILLNINGGDPHVVLFVGWANKDHTAYEAYEEAQGLGAVHDYGETDYAPIAQGNKLMKYLPYPYRKGYYSSEQDYVPMRLDPSKVEPPPPYVPLTRPGGIWVPPSPSDRTQVNDIVHFAAYAYPTYPTDPAILYVNFTVGWQGSWHSVCSAYVGRRIPIPAPAPIPNRNAQLYSCDANLKTLGYPGGQLQVSFDVYDTAGGFNLAPNGVHTLTYVHPTPTPEVKTVEVSSTQGWQDTGVVVNVGNQVVIRYISGLWTDQAGSILPFAAAGEPSGYTCANYIPASQCVEPVPDAVKGSLVGMIGTQVIKIGDYLSFTATQGGSLFLRMNDSDDGLYDNQGSITVQIEIS